MHSRKLTWKSKKAPYKDFSPSKRGPLWVSMLVWESVVIQGLKRDNIVLTMQYTCTSAVKPLEPRPVPCQRDILSIN